MTTRNPAAADWWTCTDLPLWVRVCLFAAEHHGQQLGPGVLRAEVGPHVPPVRISEAIARGVRAGLLAHDSTARVLYVVRT